MSTASTQPPTLNSIEPAPPPTTSETPPHMVVCDPDHVGVPTGPADRLQEVLPQIKELAMRVGGLKQLAEIVNELDKEKR